MGVELVNCRKWQCVPLLPIEIEHGLLFFVGNYFENISPRDSLVHNIVNFEKYRSLRREKISHYRLLSIQPLFSPMNILHITHISLYHENDTLKCVSTIQDIALCNLLIKFI